MKKLLLTICIVIITSKLGWAYYVLLDNNKLKPSEGKIIQTMFIINEQNDYIALEITPKTRGKDELGNEVNTDTDDILVIPFQVLLPPNSEQAVNIQWIGENVVKAEIPFRIIVEQIPIDLNPTEQKVPMMNTKIRFIKSL